MSESLIDLHLDEVPDPTVVEGNEEYQLTIKSAKIEESKSGTGRMVVKILAEVEDRPEAQPIFENLCFPIASDKASTVYMFKSGLKAFFQSFGIDPAAPGEPDEWIGNQGYVILKVAPDQNGNDRNEIAKYIIPK